MSEMNHHARSARLLPASIIIAIVLAIGFGMSLIELPPTQPGWWQRGLLSAGVLVVALAITGLVCTCIGNQLRFSPRINGAIVMAIGFVLVRMPFYLAGLSNDESLRSLGSAALTGAIVGAAIGPRFQTMAGLRQNQTETHANPSDPKEEIP